MNFWSSENQLFEPFDTSFRGLDHDWWVIFDRSFREFTENGTEERKYVRLLFKPTGKFNQIGKIERYNSTSATISSITRIEESEKCW